MHRIPGQHLLTYEAHLCVMMRLSMQILKELVYQPFSVIFGHGRVAVMACGSFVWGHWGLGHCG